jgi:hypothetical protein
MKTKGNKANKTIPKPSLPTYSVSKRQRKMKKKQHAKKKAVKTTKANWCHNEYCPKQT